MPSINLEFLQMLQSDYKIIQIFIETGVIWEKLFFIWNNIFQNFIQ